MEIDGQYTYICMYLRTFFNLAQVMMRLLNISNEYWEEYVNPSEQFELIRSPDFTVKSPTPLNLGSPVTPEVTPSQLNKMIITSFLYVYFT